MSQNFIKILKKLPHLSGGLALKIGLHLALLTYWVILAVGTFSLLN